jgi:hypothetical protein
MNYADQNIQIGTSTNCLSGKSLDLTIPDHAYMFGFIQADGHLYETSRNRGKLQIELNEVDEIILTHFARLIHSSSSITRRTRATNFSKEHSSATLRVYDKQFRDELKSLGLTAGKKSNLVELPRLPFSKVDYFRGVLDADGSLGLTGRGFPFISLVTASEAMAEGYLSFIVETVGKSKAASRNKRDGVYNIVAYKEDAQLLTSRLYYQDCLGLPRKKESAKTLLAWTRPTNMKKIDFKKKTWSQDEDRYILAHTIEDSCGVLDRTVKSVKTRLWRLRDK